MTVIGLACGACSLFVSLDDLQNDDAGMCAADCDGGIDSASDAGKDAAEDAATIDASDASSFDPANGCPLGRGSPMVRIGSYCIDVTEVTTDQYYAFSDAVAAGDASVVVPGACAFKGLAYAPTFDEGEDCTATTNDRANGSLPVVCVDFCDAFAYCAWAGKRLCGVNGEPALSAADLVDPKISEWMSACTNGGADDYPYGSSFIEGACNTLQGDGGTPPGAARKNVGTLSQCVGAVGADDAGRRPFDMSGNVDEWADYCDGDSGASDLCYWLGDSWSFADGPVGQCKIQDVDVRTAHFHDLGIRCCGTPAP